MEHIFLAISSIADLFVRYRPWKTKSLSDFAFLVHPRHIEDIHRKYPLLKYFPDKLVKFLLAYFFWPVTVSQVSGAVKWHGQHKEINGWIISIPITADQMINNRKLAQKSIVEAAKLAEKKGAKIIGLGALTASLTRGGLDIIPHIKSGITTGRIYTSKIIIDTAELAMGKMGLKKEDVKIAIVGAAGSIGTACAHVLAKDGFKEILLIDLPHKQSRLDILANRLRSLNKSANIIEDYRIDSIKTADIVIAATNHPDALIKSEHLKPGAIVVDDAQPSDVDPEVILKRNDVLVLEGGVVHASGIDPHFNLGLKHKEDIFSCLAETIILSVANHEGNFQVGEIFEFDISAFNKISEYSKKLGFRVSEFQNFSKVYSKSDLVFVKNIISRQNV